MQDPEETREADITELPGTTARYIASLTEELALLAKRNGLDSLSYILDMARLEADQVSRDSGGPSG